MAIVLANGKKAKLIEQERTFLNTLIVHLFKNNLVPAGANVAADFVEVTDTGYAAASIGGFTLATLNGANQGQVIAPTITWTFTHAGGDFTIYGYYVIDPADGLLVFSERAGVPFTVTGAGQTFSLTPKKVMDTM